MSKANGKPLRFAALIRVSSEKQEKKGESLRTQEQQVTAAVTALGGAVAARYAGQEHATAGWEREQLAKLMTDATRRSRPFDAVMVADASRWSRDNGRSEQDLDTLRDHGIRFFVLLQEFNLFEPNARAILGLQTTMHAYQAALLAQKSILNRIAKARKGELGVGALPWGRVYNKSATRPEERWSLDPAKKAMIEDIAKRYIAGEPLAALAAEYHLDRGGLCRTLATRCGTEWTMTFKSKRFNIREQVTIQIPPLLDAKTIEAVAERAAANKTYKHGHLKHRYLFSRMAFCGHCGSALSGQCVNGSRYYYHLGNRCLRGGVRADQLEAVVVRHLFETFGNAAAVERAIKEATPDLDKVKEEQKRLERLTAELTKVRQSRSRVLDFIISGKLTNEQAACKLDELNEKEAKLHDNAECLRRHLENLPDARAITATAARMALSTRWRITCRQINEAFDEMTWEERRQLAEMVFSGHTPDGRRMGIYIKRVEGQEGRRYRRWDYAIHGHLIDEEGSAPMSEEMMEFAFSSLGAPHQKRLLSKVRRNSTPR
jgi:site-specific DNA recombinase